MVFTIPVLLLKPAICISTPFIWQEPKVEPIIQQIYTVLPTTTPAISETIFILMHVLVVQALTIVLILIIPILPDLHPTTTIITEQVQQVI